MSIFIYNYFMVPWTGEEGFNLAINTFVAFVCFVIIIDVAALLIKNKLKLSLYNKVWGFVVLCGYSIVYDGFYWYVAIPLHLLLLLLYKYLEKKSNICVIANEEKGIYSYKIWEMKTLPDTTHIDLKDGRIKKRCKELSLPIWAILLISFSVPVIKIMIFSFIGYGYKFFP